MEIPDEIEIKILGSQEFISELETEAKSRPDSVEIIYSGEEQDSTKLNFDIATVAAIVAIVQGVFYLGELAAKIYAGVKAKQTRVVIQTAVGKAEIIYSEKLTEEEVRKILIKLIEVEP